MARIELRSDTHRRGAFQLIINGVDVSGETYIGSKLVAVGSHRESQEVGLRVTYAVSELVIDDVEVNPATLLGRTLGEGDGIADRVGADAEAS